MTETFHDPYGSCETDCTHDLARGATAEELRDSDGPYPDSSPLEAVAARIAAAAAQQQASRVET